MWKNIIVLIILLRMMINDDFRKSEGINFNLKKWLCDKKHNCEMKFKAQFCKKY